MGQPRDHVAGRRRLDRRTFLRDLGGAVVMVALAACTSDASNPRGDGSTATSGGGTGSADTPRPGATTGGVAPTTGDGLRWERVIGGVSSAYVVVRGGEATIVDTGLEGTAPAIADGLEALGMGWDDVSSVVLTHRHNDHVGSLGAVAERAGSARLLAGAGDIEAIARPRELGAVGNGDTVMGLQVHETPGHTPGHVSMFDPQTRLLVAGDALNGTEDGGVAGPNPDFTPDMDTAWASAALLAELQPDTILFGHGPPATDNATDNLQATLPE